MLLFLLGGINLNALIDGEIIIPPNTQVTEVIVKYNGDILMVATTLSAAVEILNESYAIFTLDSSKIDELMSFSQVEYIELPKTLTYMISRANVAACITSAQERYTLSGRGVIVGIIDSGIDYTHADFRNEDGTTRIISIWDQSALAGTPPSGFRSGTEYTAAQINAALEQRQPYSVIPRLDSVGHGTAVAGIAAGNGRSGGGQQRAAAYEASIIAVRIGSTGNPFFARTTEIMRAYKYIQDKAIALNMPLVINLSYGTNDGSHDGGSLFETYIDSMADRWKSVFCVATGNEGFGGHHFAGSVKQGESIEVEFVNAGYLPRFYMTMWKDFADTFIIELIAPNGDTTGQIRPNSGISNHRIGNANVTVVYGVPSHYNVSQEIYFDFTAAGQQIPPGLWQLRITAAAVVDGNFNIWLPVIEDVTPQTAFTLPTPDLTLTLPSTALRVLSVGAYNSTIRTAADFSGRGFTRSVVYIKPDIVAPGVGIIAPRPGGGYDAFTGTSIATPFVTGAVALMLEWGIVRGNDPFLYGQKVKAFLRKGANREFATTYPNRIWGYGTLCLRSSMDLLAGIQNI